MTLHVFRNVDRRPVRRPGPNFGEVHEFITKRHEDGRCLPVAVDDSDGRLFATLSEIGAPEPVADGLEVMEIATFARRAV